MAKFEVFRADINKVLVTTEQRTADDAFGAWASAAMVTGFLVMNDRKYIKHLGGDKWSVTSAAGKTFEVEVRAL
jgi:hypothetical protein